MTEVAHRKKTEAQSTIRFASMFLLLRGRYQGLFEKCHFGTPLSVNHRTKSNNDSSKIFHAEFRPLYHYDIVSQDCSFSKVNVSVNPEKVGLGGAGALREAQAIDGSRVPLGGFLRVGWHVQANGVGVVRARRVKVARP